MLNHLEAIDGRAELCGVPGRMTRRTGSNPALWIHQLFKSDFRPATGYGNGAEIRATLRFDDSCQNGHNTFSITAEVYTPASKRRGDIEAGGCLHDDIARTFPEFAELIPFHLFSDDGPMHYIANALYHAGDADHSGRRAGEPSRISKRLRFGSVPMLFPIPSGIAAFLAEIADHEPEGKRAAMIPVAVAHEAREPGGFAFKPKFQFAGQPPLKWHQCPFDTEEEALAFAESVIVHGFEIVEIVEERSEGKPRDLDAARRIAIWPEATDAELCQPRDVLRAALEARLPALLERFRDAMTGAGFTLSPADAAKAAAETV